jgi:hypothetical protein
MFLEAYEASAVEFVAEGDAGPVGGVGFAEGSAEEKLELSRLSALERSVQELGKRLNAAHELMERVIEANVVLRRGVVPQHEAEKVEQAAAQAGVSSSSSEGGRPKVVNLVLSADGTSLAIKGRTFDIKDDLKSRFGASWNASMKTWTVDASYESAVTEYLRAQSFEVK